MTSSLAPTYGFFTFLSWAVFPSLMVLSERYLRAKAPYWMIMTIFGSTVLHGLTWIDLNLRAPRQGPELNDLMFKVQYILLAIHVWPGVLLVFWRGSMGGSKNPSLLVKWFHIIFGYANVVVVAVMVLFGYIEVGDLIWQVPGQFHRNMYLGFLILAAFLLAICEYGWWHNWFSTKSYIRSLTPYTLDKLREEVAQGKQYLCFNNKVVDIGDWAKYHPGGKYAIEKNFGTDIGRYLYGVYKINEDHRAYNHSEYAYNRVKDHVVGELYQNYDLREKMLHFKPGVVPAETSGWTLYSRKPITDLIKRIEFTKEGVTRTLFIHDSTVWGKFIRIKAVTDWGSEVTRFYTFSQALTDKSMESHDHAIECFEKKEDVAQKLDPKTQVEACFAIYPKLYHYPYAFSRFLHETPIDSGTQTFQIFGPMGLGLGLDKKSNGSYLALTAGTGIVPLMDVVMYQLRRNLRIYGAGLNLDLQTIMHEPMDLVGDNFNFELWGNFRKAGEVVGLKYLYAAQRVSEITGKKNFHLNLRLSEEEETPRWNEEYMRKKLEGKDFEKIFIRGPQQFNWSMEEMLIRVGFKASSIIHL